MSEETIRGKIIFGKNAKEETRNISYSTSYQFVERTTIKVTKGSVTAIQTGYKKLNLAEQKKEDTCRKLNKMIGGY